MVASESRAAVRALNSLTFNRRHRGFNTSTLRLAATDGQEPAGRARHGPDRERQSRAQAHSSRRAAWLEVLDVVRRPGEDGPVAQGDSNRRRLSAATLMGPP